jgi:hypothetical protein
MVISRQRRVFVLLAAVGLFGVVFFGPRTQVAADTLPVRLTDRAFWQMVTAFSEPNGFFRSDNFISNEMAFQQVIPDLKKRIAPGGVYLGVGPDQNFTYITAFQPRLAFIVDIRRQNMLQHLMYKALIEMSEDRADFLSHLFSRARPAGLSTSSTPQVLLDAYNEATPSETLYQANLHAVLDRLVKRHGFALREEDRTSLGYVFRAFYSDGPGLRYSFPRQGDARWFPTYADLMTQTDLTGNNHAYLATEEHYKVLREAERNNLIVPIVGDFGGDKALRSVGSYLKEHGATVAFFYTSNVEQYLFQSDAWAHFYENVAMLPIESSSTFIRSYFSVASQSPALNFNMTIRSETLLEPISDAVNAYRTDQLRAYMDIIDRSR